MTMHLASRGRQQRSDLVLDFPVPGSGLDHSGVHLVGTYPPTACGIASYTANLRAVLTETTGGDRAFPVVRLLQEGDPNPDAGDSPEVVAMVRPEDPDSVAEGAAVLAGSDSILLQHEFGIYGPGSGEAVLDLVGEDGPPLVVTMHTAINDPTPEQRSIVDRLGERAERIVVHSEIACGLLIDGYGADPERVEVIPHGSKRLAGWEVGPVGEAGEPMLLTWGLIGPGKGLEWTVMALAGLRTAYPGIRYVIAGRTHPKVAAREGEAYRDLVLDLARRLGVADAVEMVDRYLSPEELAALLAQAAVVVLPYDSTEQTSSGVLSEAVAAGIPVVATGFPHAVELARIGAVSVVPHRDPTAMAGAIERLLGDPLAVADMLLAQQELSGISSWEEVAWRYLEVMEQAREAARR